MAYGAKYLEGRMVGSLLRWNNHPALAGTGEELRKKIVAISNLDHIFLLISKECHVFSRRNRGRNKAQLSNPGPLDPLPEATTRPQSHNHRIKVRAAEKSNFFLHPLRDAEKTFWSKFAVGFCVAAKKLQSTSFQSFCCNSK